MRARRAEEREREGSARTKRRALFCVRLFWHQILDWMTDWGRSSGDRAPQFQAPSTSLLTLLLLSHTSHRRTHTLAAVLHPLLSQKERPLAATHTHGHEQATLETFAPSPQVYTDASQSYTDARAGMNERARVKREPAALLSAPLLAPLTFWIFNFLCTRRRGGGGAGRGAAGWAGKRNGVKKKNALVKKARNNHYQQQ